MKTTAQKVSEMTDDELAEELREQVNRSRNNPPHDRDMARGVGEEMKKRGWNIRKPSNV